MIKKRNKLTNKTNNDFNINIVQKQWGICILLYLHPVAKKDQSKKKKKKHLQECGD